MHKQVYPRQHQLRQSTTEDVIFSVSTNQNDQYQRALFLRYCAAIKRVGIIIHRTTSASADARDKPPPDQAGSARAVATYNPIMAKPAASLPMYPATH